MSNHPNDQYDKLERSNGSKNSLRRKPPPSLDIAKETKNKLIIPLESTQFMSPHFPGMPESRSVPVPIGNGHQQKLSIDTDNYAYNEETLPVGRQSLIGGGVYESEYGGEFTDESFMSFDSPRPMGPKTLPGFEEYTTPVKPPRLPLRPQNEFVRRESQPNPPYPTNDIQIELDLSDDDDNHSQKDNYNFFSPELTPSRLHYSFNERNNHQYTPSKNQTTPPNHRTSEIISQSLNTPTKIPSLNESNTLGMPVQGRQSRHVDRDSSFSDNSGRSSSSSPNSRNSKFSMKMNSIGGTSASPPRHSSPTRSYTMIIPERNSPTNGNYMERVYSERRSSRSPSPKKAYGRSPSLIYDHQPFNSEAYYDNNNSLEELENKFDSEHLRQRRWNSLDTGETKSDISDYQYNDDEDPYSDIPETTTTNYFDYSILPDLPSTNTSADGQPSSPSKRITLNSTLSFLKRDSQPNLSSPTSTIRRRKDDELPPVPLDLPQLPFTSSSLAMQHFNACKDIWSLSNIFEWCLKLKTWLHDLFIPKREFKKALIKLLVFYKRDIPLDIIGQNVDQIIFSLLEAKAISYAYNNDIIDNDEDDNETAKKRNHKDELGVIIDANINVNGVLPDLTNCYCHDEDHKSNVNNNDESRKLKCYSSQCHLNQVIDHEIQLRNTNINEIVLGDDWASHWRLTAEDLRRFDKTVSKRQSLIFDLLKYEQTFIQRAKCFVDIVGPDFIKAAQILIGSHEIILINKFEDDVLKPGKELIQIHEKSLFEPLLRILISDGRFIKALVDIADIYYNWSKVVKSSLLKYMSTVPMIEDLLKNESMKRWVDVEVRNIQRVKELKVNGSLLFMSTFNSRYQQLPLQLSDIRKLFDSQEPEYVSLTKSIDSIKRLGSKVNEMKVHADNIHALKKIHKQLIWKNNVNHVNANLGSENRRFFHRGDLTRKGDLKINSSTNHLILLDNFLFITERVKNPKMSLFSYKIVENPIAIELLVFEIKEKESIAPTLELKPITKSLTTLSNPASPVHAQEFLDGEVEPASYPFKLRFAGRGKHNAFTFSTKTERERKDWINHFSMAKTNLCRRLRKTEPYKLKTVANTCFAYEISNKISKLQVCAPYDPIEEASTDALNKLNELGCKGDIYTFNNARSYIVFSKAQSITSFEYSNTKFYLVGLATGVYCCDMQNRWKKVIGGADITKIKVITSINLLIVLGGRHLRCYSLDLVVGVYYNKKEHLSSISLSNEHVLFFAVGKHREINMLFYAKKKTNSSGTTNFKVLIPETDNDGMFSAFKVIKKFYVQAECYGISIFNTSFAVHTNKGFEILELDKLLPRSIPEFPHNESSGKKIDGFSRRSITGGVYNSGVDLVKKAVHSTNVRPMGMFKLNNNTEFLLVYNDCAIFTNKHGKLSRYSMLKFEFKAKAIAFINNHLFLVCDEVMEIWSISDFVNGSNRLIQVVTGKDMNMLNNEDSVYFAMANPKVPGLQLLFELQPKEVLL